MPEQRFLTVTHPPIQPKTLQGKFTAASERGQVYFLGAASLQLELQGLTGPVKTKQNKKKIKNKQTLG